jgi:hypothetical protein
VGTFGKRLVRIIGLAVMPFYPLLRERLARFRHHYGQPAEVRSAFEEAMGLK